MYKCKRLNDIENIWHTNVHLGTFEIILKYILSYIYVRFNTFFILKTIDIIL